MAIFGSKKRGDPIQHLEGEIEGLQARRSRLQAHLAASQAQRDEAITARRKFLVTGDLDNGAGATEMESRANATDLAVRSAQDGLSEVDRLLAAAEHELGQARDREQREAVASELAQHREALTIALEPFRPTVEAIISAFEKVDYISPEFMEAKLYLGQVRDTLPACIDAGLATLERTIAGIREGRTSIPRRPTEPKPAPPKPATKRIFPLKNIKYRNDRGAIVTIGQYWDADVPIAVAARAEARNLCIDPSSDQARRLRFQRGAFGAAAVDCHDLDDENAPPPKVTPRLPVDMIEVTTERDIGSASFRP